MIKDNRKPFKHSTVHFKNKGEDDLWTMNFIREFDPDFGARWEKGQMKQLVIGANFGSHEVSGMDMRGHAHKIEMRLGNEIQPEWKQKGWTRKLHSADIAL